MVCVCLLLHCVEHPFRAQHTPCGQGNRPGQCCRSKWPSVVAGLQDADTSVCRSPRRACWSSSTLVLEETSNKPLLPYICIYMHACMQVFIKISKQTGVCSSMTAVRKLSIALLLFHESCGKV